jgi:putative ABC transport system permease protein
MRVLRDEAAAPARIRRAIIFTGAGLVGLLLCWVAQRNGALQQWQPGVGQLGVGVASTAFIVATGAWGPLVLLAAARFIRRRGAAARLGLANLTRDPGRTATMVAAVSAPVATAFIITSFVAAIHDGVTHNVTTGAAGLVRVSSLDPNNTINLESKLSPATLAALARLPGVAHVHRGAYVLSGHDPKTLIGVKASEHPFFTLTVLRGTADPARFARGEALVGPGIARRLQLRPGSKVRLDTPSGWSSVTVQGVWQDGDVNGSVVSMPMPLLESLYGPQSAQEVFLEPSPGSTTGRVARTVRAAGLDPRLQVQTPTELARTISKDINGQFASFWAIQRALLLVAFVAVLSTLLLVAVQRRRELALLAAVGMQPVEMGRMVVLEGVAVGVLGSALVTVFGTGTYFALHEVIPIIIGFRDPFRVAPAAIILWGVVATVIVAGAAALPAVRTARVEVVENLKYE